MAIKSRDAVGQSPIISLVKDALRMPSPMTQPVMGYIRAILSLIRNIAHSSRKLLRYNNLIYYSVSAHNTCQ